jgi:hypothetical protein
LPLIGAGPGLSDVGVQHAVSSASHLFTMGEHITGGESQTSDVATVAR